MRLLNLQGISSRIETGDQITGITILEGSDSAAIQAQAEAALLLVPDVEAQAVLAANEAINAANALATSPKSAAARTLDRH